MTSFDLLFGVVSLLNTHASFVNDLLTIFEFPKTWTFAHLDIRIFGHAPRERRRHCARVGGVAVAELRHKRAFTDELLFNLITRIKSELH